jgi:hypothetical protein
MLIHSAHFTREPATSVRVLKTGLPALPPAIGREATALPRAPMFLRTQNTSGQAGALAVSLRVGKAARLLDAGRNVRCREQRAEGELPPLFLVVHNALEPRDDLIRPNV